MGAESLANVTLGFYGGGMMAEAILRGLLSKKVIPAEQIWVCELVKARREMLATLGVSVTADGKEMLAECDVTVLAVKPDVVSTILKTVSEVERGEKDTSATRLFISICAGVPLKALAEGNAERCCVRVMPNQPCMVGEAASAYTVSKGCSDKHRQIVVDIMGACGFVTELPEKNLDAVTGLSGSGPAYVYMMIEAMADGGVRKGLPRAVALKLAAQTVLGAARIAVDSPDVHPAELRNRVESPGGTTIAATAALEQEGFRASLISAVGRAAERSEELGRK